MVRPSAKELTEREMEVMHIFWEHGEITAADAREHLAQEGLHRSHSTIANLIRILKEKGFLQQTNKQRPYLYAPARSHTDVSGQLLQDMIHRVFRGCRESALLQMVEQRKLTPRERELLEAIIKEAGE